MAVVVTNDLFNIKQALKFLGELTPSTTVFFSFLSLGKPGYMRKPNLKKLSDF